MIILDDLAQHQEFSMARYNYDMVDRVASGLLGIPYKHYGRSRIGVDCLGLVVVFFKELLGVRLTMPTSGYPRYLSNEYNFIEWYDGDEFKEVLSAEPVDVVSMAVRSNVENHLGILLPDGTVLSTDETSGVHRVRRFLIRDSIRAFYRFDDKVHKQIQGAD